ALGEGGEPGAGPRPADVPPVQVGLEFDPPWPLGLRGAHMSAVQALGEVEEPVPQVPLMTPEDGRIDRHDESAAARRLRAPYQVGREPAVRLDVELKPEATRLRTRGGGDLLDGGRGGHADDHEELRIPGGPP